MVNIVVVSHSAKLAEGVCELAEQVVRGRVAIAAAGGMDDPRCPLGTDVFKVQRAIESVYSPDGVLVLMDLGSALLSAETALESLDPSMRAQVRLCAAPLVEGTIAAAVHACTGAPLARVLDEAVGSLAAKSAHLEGTGCSDPGAGGPVDGEAAPTGVLQVRLKIRNPMGLHARPAAQVVKTAARFAADVILQTGGKSASAKSINQVATLGVRQDQEIVLSARGADAAEALAALTALAGEDFGESGVMIGPPVPKPAASVRDGEWKGVPASPGLAVGPACRYRPSLPEVPEYAATDNTGEWRRIEAAIAESCRELEALQEKTRRRIGPGEAAILDVHRMFLHDPALQDEAKAAVFEGGRNAESAWQSAVENNTRRYRELDDECQRARAVDLFDAGQRVLRHLLGATRSMLTMDGPGILVAREVTPSDVAGLDPGLVLGICTQAGGATSHAAILARALGIPAVVALDGALDRIEDGQIIALDGGAGCLWVDPSPEQLTRLRKRQDTWRREQEEAKTAGRRPAVTRDGHPVCVAANIGTPADTAPALECGAEGVGLFRTEYLFLDRSAPPDEEEQLAAYQSAAKAMGDRPVTIRTLDVGGDKPLPYLAMDAEDNPFLGLRGIRLCLSHEVLFKMQLRAVLRAGCGGNIRLMLPMIGTVTELRAARWMLADVQSELRSRGVGFDERMEVGIMVEVPSAVAMMDHLAAEADFFSIGTNDLTQYVMAADRGNGRVAGLVNALQPALLRMIRRTVEAAHSAGKRVGLCGELAGNPLAAPLLVGLGLDELSMSASAIPAVKAAIRKVSHSEAEELARHALSVGTAEEVERLLGHLA